MNRIRRLATVLLAAGLCLSGETALAQSAGGPADVPGRDAHDAAHHDHGVSDDVRPAVLAAGLGAVADDALRACRGRRIAAKHGCYTPHLIPHARAGDPATALALLDTIARRDPDVYADGHMYAHAIGLAAYDPGRPFGPQFDACNESFHAGCYHGLIQAHFAAAHHLDGAALDGLCAEVGRGGEDRWIVFQCIHGIGHGLVVYHGHDLLAALADCDALSQPWDRDSCYGGAFMENITNAILPHHADMLADHGAAAHRHDEPAFIPIREDDPHYPCTIVEEHHLAACYSVQTSAILHLNGRDFAAAARTCDGAPAGYVAMCHLSLGRDATGDASRDHAETHRLCELDRSVYASWCWVGAAKAMVDWENRPEDGLAFCRTVEAATNRAACFEAVGEQIATSVNDASTRRALCDAAGATEDVAACGRGAGLTSRSEDRRDQGDPPNATDLPVR